MPGKGVPFQKGHKLNNNSSGARDGGYNHAVRWLGAAIGSKTSDELKQMWDKADQGDELNAASVDRRNRALSATGCKVPQDDNQENYSPEVMRAIIDELAEERAKRLELERENIELKVKRKVSKK